MLDRPRRAVEHELGEDRAVALVNGDPEELGLADRVPRALRELFGLVPVSSVGQEVPLGHLTCERAQRLLVVALRERVGHGHEA